MLNKKYNINRKKAIHSAIIKRAYQGHNKHLGGLKQQKERSGRLREEKIKMLNLN